MSNDSNRSQSGLPLADRRLIRRQRLRLTFVSAGILAAIWTLLSTGVYVVLVERTISGIDAGLYTALNEGENGYLPHRLDEPELSHLPQPPLHLEDHEQDFAIWRNHSTWQLANSSSSLSFGLQTVLATYVPLATRETSLYSVQVSGNPYRLIEKMSQDGTVIQIAENVAGQFDVLRDLVTLVLLAGAFGVALTIVGGYALGLWTLRPFIAARRRERELLSDVSHELRTPLSVMGTHLELLLRHTEDREVDRMRWLSAVYAENGRMRRLLDELLQLARLDAGMEQLKQERTSLRALCDDLALLYEPVVSAKGLTFHWNPPVTSCDVWGDPERLRQILYILLDNACKYTESGDISLSIKQESHWLVIAVRDTGRGMPEHFVSRATERFVRADHARSDRSSSGLGLSIADRLIAAHGGKLQFHSQLGKGTEVQVFLKMLANEEEK